MRAALGPALAVLTALPAAAQDWATVEVCSVDAPRIEDAAFAPTDYATLQAKAAAIPNGTGRFWRITAPNGAVSHLWGTFHSADPLILDLPQVAREAIAESRTVAVEVDFTHKTRDSIRDAQMLEGRFNEGGDPFAVAPSDGTVAGLPAEVTGWVRDRAIELGWTEDFDLVLSLPGMAEMLLSDPCEDFTDGILPIQDDYIQLLGRIAGAEILGLEGQDDFIARLAADEETAQAVIATYAAYLRPVDTNAERAASFALYLEGQLGTAMAWDAAHQQSVYGERGIDLLQQADAYLLTERNRHFIDRLKDHLAQGDTFIAVGFFHIPGEAGLVALLTDIGYQVTRIPLPGERP